MMMLADCSASHKDMHMLSDELRAVGEEIGCTILMQREDIFDKMHRI